MLLLKQWIAKLFSMLPKIYFQKLKSSLVMDLTTGNGFMNNDSYVIYFNSLINISFVLQI